MSAVPPRGGKASRGGPQRRPSSRQAAQIARNRKKRAWYAGVAVVVVVAVIAVLVVVGLGSKASTAAAPRIALTAAQSQQLQSVPVDSLLAASSGVSNLTPAYELTSSTPLTTGSKPQILFIGAEFCPICATERWALAVALSQFGTFTNLSQIRSANRDGDIATLSFYGSTYSSPYISFVPVEAETNIPNGPSTYKNLQNPSAEQEKLWETIDGEFGESPSFPFIDFGGKLALLSDQYSESLLSGKSFDQILSTVGVNSNTLGYNIDAGAAAITKYICSLTGDQPAKVCSAVTTVQAPISSGTSSSSGASSSAG